MPSFTCPYCDSSDIDYVGVEDGGGDYGDSLCDIWLCHGCGHEFEKNCVEFIEPDYDEEAGAPAEPDYRPAPDSFDYGDIPF